MTETGRNAGGGRGDHPIGVPIDPGPPPVLLKPWPPRVLVLPPRIAALFERYRPLSVRDAIVPVLRHADALRFLDDCERVGLEVLGMDFFCLEEGGLRICHYASFADPTTSEGGNGVARGRAMMADGLPERAHAVEIVVSDPTVPPAPRPRRVRIRFVGGRYDGRSTSLEVGPDGRDEDALPPTLTSMAPPPGRDFTALGRGEDYERDPRWRELVENEEHVPYRFVEDSA